jgi:hypothetical protein
MALLTGDPERSFASLQADDYLIWSGETLPVRPLVLPPSGLDLMMSRTRLKPTFSNHESPRVDLSAAIPSINIRCG